MIRSNIQTTGGIVIAALVLAVSATAQAGTSDAQLIADSHATVAVFKRTDPGLGPFFANAPGYVVFPTVTKGAFGVGGAHGDGIVFQAGHPVGRASLSQITVGAQLGGQEYSEVIFFETPMALANFQQGNTEFSGQVSAVALKSGASADAKYRNGVAVFTAAQGGLMFEASLGGQKFKYEPINVKQH